MADINENQISKFLTFCLNQRTYGVDIQCVREINRVSDITPVPQTPSHVAGVMNLRGKIIPVVSLRLRLGMQDGTQTRETCIIVIDTEQGQVGMIVDSINGVVDIRDQDVESPRTGNETGKSDILGLGKLENQVIVLLDIVRCLGDLSFSGFVPTEEAA